ncbi:MAG TPA: very short patch repair endonuclease [Rubrivivax sp.]|nr:very short patch repair endonuclease [Rubrivivax sp.]HRY88157.1 very short patch repair endonuclease [Rubrivivax sp.]HRZ59235.1 very short patch repair endonuclease [Rubrivivax sp.]
MADTISSKRRSALMSRIRSKDTQPELAVRRLLHSFGYRYVLHDSRLPGKPDLVFPSRGKVIFVHGCFWHGHTCAKASKPKSNADYWLAKIAGNKARDRQHNRALRGLGWRVLTVFECAAQPSRIDRLTPRLIRFLES